MSNSYEVAEAEGLVAMKTNLEIFVTFWAKGLPTYPSGLLEVSTPAYLPILTDSQMVRNRYFF